VTELQRVDAHRAEPVDISIVDHLMAVWRRRWLVIGVFVLAVVAAVVYSLVAPKVYESTVALLSPKESSGSGVLSGLVASGVAPALGLSMPSTSSNLDMLVGLVKSRTVALAVVEKFKLRERYQMTYVQDAIKAFQETKTQVDVSKEGVITLTVADWDPKLAAEMVNFWIQQVDRLASTYGTSEGQRQRVFVAEQLTRSKVDLERAEDALRRFQERNQAITLQDQTRGAIEAAARLKGEVVASEVQLQVMKSFATDANPDVVSLRRRIEEMKRQLGAIQYGEGPSGQREEFHVPFSKVPKVGLDLIRLTRDVKVQETVLGLLTQQLEQAKITEAKDLPIVQIIDPGVPAERHSRPKLVFNVAVTGAIGMVFAVLLALFLDLLTAIRIAWRAKAAA
jgi:capsule polysaccharide export protein KpsE/RkpR